MPNLDPVKTPSRLWILLALALLSLPAVVIAQPPAGAPGEPVWSQHARGGHGPGAPGERLFGNLRFLADFLELIDEQIEQARLLREELKASVQPLGEDVRALRQELHTLLDGDDPDAGEVGTLVIEQHQLRQEMKALMEGALEDFRSLLTAEQQELFDRLRESRPDRPGRREGRRGGPGAD